MEGQPVEPFRVPSKADKLLRQILYRVAGLMLDESTNTVEGLVGIGILSWQRQ